MGSGAAASDTADYSTLVDLASKFDKSKCYARNEASKYPMTNLFLGDSRLGCISDTDDQLIVHIEFQEVVKVINRLSLCLKIIESLHKSFSILNSYGF